MKRTDRVSTGASSGPSRRIGVTLVSAIALTLMSACGGSDGSGGDDDDDSGGAQEAPGSDGGGPDSGGTTGGGSTGGTVTALGIVNLGIDNGPTDAETALNANFLSVSDGFPIDGLVPPAGEDRCFVNDESDITIDPTDIDLTEVGAGAGTSLSAGETLTVTSPAGTYTTLLRETQVVPGFGTLSFYDTPDGELIAGEAPSGLVIDIPGDEFPAFADVSLPDAPAPLSDFSPALDASVSAATTFTWTPSGNADARLELTLDGNDESVDCILADDGSFTLPGATAAELVGPDVLVVGELVRGAIRTVQSGNAALRLYSVDDR